MIQYILVKFCLWTVCLRAQVSVMAKSHDNNHRDNDKNLKKIWDPSRVATERLLPKSHLL